MTTTKDTEQDGTKTDREAGISTEMLSDDYLSIDVILDEGDIESLKNGSGITWEVGDDDETVGVYVGAEDTSGFGEYAFKSYVEDEYGEGTYRLDLALRVLRTRSFWAGVAVYTAAFISAPFVITALSGSAAVAFSYGVVLMIVLPMLLDKSPIQDAIEEAKHV